MPLHNVGAHGGHSGLSGALRELSIEVDFQQHLDGGALAALTGLQALSVSESLDATRSQV